MLPAASEEAISAAKADDEAIAYATWSEGIACAISMRTDDWTSGLRHRHVSMDLHVVMIIIAGKPRGSRVAFAGEAATADENMWRTGQTYATP